MRLFDGKFKDNKRNYILQSLAAGGFIFGVLLLIDFAFDMVVIASIGASAFIAFTMPCSQPSSPRCLVGGYSVGAVCGVTMNYLYMHLSSVMNQRGGNHVQTMLALVSAIAVGMALFLMAVMNFEHPPAVALALGLTREPKVVMAAFVAMVSIVLMSLIKELFKKHMKDLL